MTNVAFSTIVVAARSLAVWFQVVDAIRGNVRNLLQSVLKLADELSPDEMARVSRCNRPVMRLALRVRR